MTIKNADDSKHELEYFALLAYLISGLSNDSPRYHLQRHPNELLMRHGELGFNPSQSLRYYGCLETIATIAIELGLRQETEKLSCL